MNSILIKSRIIINEIKIISDLCDLFKSRGIRLRFIKYDFYSENMKYILIYRIMIIIYERNIIDDMKYEFIWC